MRLFLAHPPSQCISCAAQEEDSFPREASRLDTAAVDSIFLRGRTSFNTFILVVSSHIYEVSALMCRLCIFSIKYKNEYQFVFFKSCLSVSPELTSRVTVGCRHPSGDHGAACPEGLCAPRLRGPSSRGPVQPPLLMGSRSPSPASSPLTSWSCPQNP